MNVLSECPQNAANDISDGACHQNSKWDMPPDCHKLLVPSVPVSMLPEYALKYTVGAPLFTHPGLPPSCYNLLIQSIQTCQIDKDWSTFLYTLYTC